MSRSYRFKTAFQRAAANVRHSQHRDSHIYRTRDHYGDRVRDDNHYDDDDYSDYISTTTVTTTTTSTLIQTALAV